MAKPPQTKKSRKNITGFITRSMIPSGKPVKINSAEMRKASYFGYTRERGSNTEGNPFFGGMYSQEAEII
jgi:hypothetical protein